jgi:hypothetical protein
LDWKTPNGVVTSDNLTSGPPSYEWFNSSTSGWLVTDYRSPLHPTDNGTLALRSAYTMHTTLSGSAIVVAATVGINEHFGVIVCCVGFVVCTAFNISPNFARLLNLWWARGSPCSPFVCTA